ncbi:MAG: GGDEF domain-containing protein [Ruminococcus sp.]|nr:GGDEF domain-containing protein [Ruminococcus sp.]
MKNKTLQTVILVICSILFVGVFVMSLSTSVTMYRGLISEVQVALCVMIILTNPNRAGYISSIVLNAFSLIYKLVDMIHSHRISIGFVIYITTIILISILYFYMKTSQSQHDELQQQYEELITTKQILQEKDDILRTLAYDDKQTGMRNAHYMHLKINEAIQAGKPFQIIYFDIDNFKQIDDIHGPKAGDQAIMIYAERLCTAFQNRYLCTRMKSDKFAVFLDGERSEEELSAVIEQFRAVINKPIALQMQSYHLSASYGIVSFPRDGGTADTLLRHAIMAVYRAKGSGKNTSCFFSRA